MQNQKLKWRKHTYARENIEIHFFNTNKKNIIKIIYRLYNIFMSLPQNEINTNDVIQSWLTVPSQSIPINFGSTINFDISTIGKINEMYLIFNMFSITGITPVCLFPVMATFFRWFTMINYM